MLHREIPNFSAITESVIRSACVQRHPWCSLRGVIIIYTFVLLFCGCVSVSKRFNPLSSSITILPFNSFFFHPLLLNYHIGNQQTLERIVLNFIKALCHGIFSSKEQNLIIFSVHFLSAALLQQWDVCWPFCARFSTTSLSSVTLNNLLLDKVVWWNHLTVSSPLLWPMGTSLAVQLNVFGEIQFFRVSPIPCLKEWSN